MSDVEKRTSALVVCFLNNSYGFFTSLQAFLNLSIMQKQQKRNKIIHKIILSPISKSSKKKKKVSKIPRDFLFDLGRIAHSRIIFAPVIKSLRNGKNTFTCLKKVLRNYALCWDLTFRKKMILRSNSNGKTSGHNIILPGKWRKDAKWQILLVWGHQQFRKFSRVFLFILENFFIVSIWQRNITISQIENHIELHYLLKTNGNT